MLRLHMMQEMEKYKKYEKYCNKDKIKELRKIFDNCMEVNNNKIESCQELRNHFEKCYQFLKRN